MEQKVSFPAATCFWVVCSRCLSLREFVSAKKSLMSWGARRQELAVCRLQAQGRVRMRTHRSCALIFHAVSEKNDRNRCYSNLHIYYRYRSGKGVWQICIFKTVPECLPIKDGVRLVWAKRSEERLQWAD